MDSRSLRCPQCGAATPSGAPRCQYCRARLATVSCPSCFGLMFADAEFCQKCGTRRARQAGPSNARCPGCRTVMAAVTLGGTSILECPACDGLWLEAAAFERICADRESQSAVLHRGATDAPAARHRVSYRPCVACGTMMNRVNFGRLSGVVVDACARHGTFLDAGELQRIVAFIQQGGLDRARQRQIDDLREERSRLQWAEARAQRAAGRNNELSWRSESAALTLPELLTLFGGK
jgi:Zn-finger nucleic acid-binding protein